MKRLMMIFVVAVLALTGPDRVEGYDFDRLPDGTPIKWEDPTVVMTLESNTLPLNGDRNNYAQHSMWTWNQVRGTRLNFVYRMEAWIL